MHELDRVLDRDDMVLPIFVGVTHHGRQRSGLARPGWPGDDDQAGMKHGKFLQHRRQRRVEFFKILEGKNFAWNLPKDCRDAIFLIKEIGAKTRDVRYLVTEIHVASFLEYLD